MLWVERSAASTGMRLGGSWSSSDRRRYAREPLDSSLAMRFAHSWPAESLFQARANAAVTNWVGRTRRTDLQGSPLGLAEQLVRAESGTGVRITLRHKIAARQPARKACHGRFVFLDVQTRSDGSRSHQSRQNRLRPNPPAQPGPNRFPVEPA